MHRRAVFLPETKFVGFIEEIERMRGRAGEAELLIAREWAILAGENEYAVDTFQQITGAGPRAR